METNLKKLILFNDDDHSYDYVNHSYEQAEQCVIIANNTGKVQIKSNNDFLTLLEIQENLYNKKLKTEII